MTNRNKETEVITQDQVRNLFTYRDGTLRFDYKLKFLGHFVNEDDAARAYNTAAKIYFGEFARLNAVD